METPLIPPMRLFFAAYGWGNCRADCFGLVFALAGYGLLFGGLRGARAARELSQRQAKHPGEPWLHRKDWAEKRVLHSSLTSVIMFGLLALIWNGVTSFVPFVVLSELSKPNPQYVILIALLFPLIGLGLIWAVCVAFLRWRRFGNSAFLLAAVPARLGDSLKGTLVAPASLVQQASQLSVRLVCQSISSTGRGKRRRTDQLVLAQGALEIPLSSGMIRDHEARVPVKIQIPLGGAATVL